MLSGLLAVNWSDHMLISKFREFYKVSEKGTDILQT